MRKTVLLLCSGNGAAVREHHRLRGSDPTPIGSTNGQSGAHDHVGPNVVIRPDDRPIGRANVLAPGRAHGGGVYPNDGIIGQTTRGAPPNRDGGLCGVPFLQRRRGVLDICIEMMWVLYYDAPI